MCTGSSLRGTKVPGLEVNDVLALNAEVRNVRDILPLPQYLDNVVLNYEQK
jgi:hypothetical protein